MLRAKTNIDMGGGNGFEINGVKNCEVSPIEHRKFMYESTVKWGIRNADTERDARRKNGSRWNWPASGLSHFSGYVREPVGRRRREIWRKNTFSR